MGLALVLLFLAALGGMFMLGMRLSAIPRPPAWLPIAHGVFAVAGFGALLYAAATTGIPLLAQIAVGLFVLVALGGVMVLVGWHLQRRPLPVGLVLVHGLLALAGIVLLLVAFFGGR